jgi:hypothetical protein
LSSWDENFTQTWMLVLLKNCPSQCSLENRSEKEERKKARIREENQRRERRKVKEKEISSESYVHTVRFKLQYQAVGLDAESSSGDQQV